MTVPHGGPRASRGPVCTPCNRSSGPCARGIHKKRAPRESCDRKGDQNAEKAQNRRFGHAAAEREKTQAWGALSHRTRADAGCADSEIGPGPGLRAVDLCCGAPRPCIRIGTRCHPLRPSSPAGAPCLADLAFRLPPRSSTASSALQGSGPMRRRPPRRSIYHPLITRASP